MRTIWILVVCLVASVGCFFAGVPPVAATTYQSHLAITINGNNAFTTVNGVVSGTGTANSPYIIEGWNITGYGEPGISIQNTNAHFIIQNVYICVGSTGGEIAILLNNVTHGVVQNTFLPRCGRGGTSILVGRSINVTLLNNNMQEYRGVWLDRSNNTLVSGNTLNAVSPYLPGPVEFYVDHSNSSVFTGNNLFGANIHFTGSKGNVAYHNNFLNQCDSCIIGSGIDDQPGLNSWDNGYPTGGNYWINHTATDRCSGPSQNICTGPDGIGDSPYHFQSGTDRYPLMLAYMDQTPPIWSASASLSAQNVGQTSLNLHWDTAADDLEMAGYRIYEDNVLIATTGRNNAYGQVLVDYPVGGLKSGTLYHFKVIAVDVANRTSADGLSMDVTTLPSWWQITAPGWWQLNWYWGIAVMASLASIAASFLASIFWQRKRRQKQLTEYPQHLIIPPSDVGLSVGDSITFQRSLSICLRGGY